MEEGSVDVGDFKLPKPQTVGILILLLFILIVGWGTFVIVPAGHRGGCPLVGECGEENHGGGA
jgi:hypothetical protein